MRKVRQIGTKGKRAALATVPRPEAVGLASVDARVALIQALVPLGLEKVAEELEQEVERLAGAWYARAGGDPHLVRWGEQRGSVYLADQKLPVTVPRVRNRQTGQEVRLETYARLQQPRGLDQGLVHRILGGISTREYARCAEAIPEAFGLSASTVSRRFKRATTRTLQHLVGRRLEAYDILVVLLDGKTFAEDEMVIAVGVTATGEKVILGFVQTATENRRVCAAFLRELMDRGLRLEQGLLVITDGAKGLQAAVREAFGDAAVLQRCQWHKRENVVSYLPKRIQVTFRRKLQAAYGEPTYAKAKAALDRLGTELALLNASAAASLAEGLEETLTLHRLGVIAALGISLKTTNIVESINARLGSRTDTIDHWRNSDQKQRWLATALIDLEPRLRRIRGHRALATLRAALEAHLKPATKTATAA